MLERLGRQLVGFLACLSPAAANDLSVPDGCGLYAYKAQIVAVYDGDTVTADVDLGFNTWRKGEKLRLYGIDAPEVRGETRTLGLKSRDALREKILGRDVVICTIKDKTGKYGRYLARVFLNDENINEWLLSEGLAEPYEKYVAGSVFASEAALRAGFVFAPLPD